MCLSPVPAAGANLEICLTNELFHAILFAHLSLLRRRVRSGKFNTFGWNRGLLPEFKTGAPVFENIYW